MDPDKKETRGGPSVTKAWFSLTRAEQQAVVILLGLFLLGVAVRVWHTFSFSNPHSGPRPALEKQ